MRKMKKINGYLVVRFNDREKREHEGAGLGSYGVIDAELYTGDLDADRDEMEFVSAETLEEAMEQARGLESELDVVEPEVKVTVIVESETNFEEIHTTPEIQIRIARQELEREMLDELYPEITPASAFHQMQGYVQALANLGMIDETDERFMVPQEWFAAVKLRKLALSPPVLDVHRLAELLRELNGYIDENASCLPERKDFLNLACPIDGRPLTSELYDLGVMLDTDCPDNDCIIYRNIFHMAKELDEALDSLKGYAAGILQRELANRISELRIMYRGNHAVKKYREAAP